MTALVLVGIMWLAVLVPPAVKRHQDRRQEFLDSFQKGLGALGATAPSAAVFDIDGPGLRGPNAVTAGPSPAQVDRRPAAAASPAQRRRTIFGLLLASMAISAVPAVVVGGKVTLAVFLAMSDCFLAYLGLVVRWRDARSLAQRPAAAPAFAYDADLQWDDDDEPLLVATPRVPATLAAG